MAKLFARITEGNVRQGTLAEMYKVALRSLLVVYMIKLFEGSLQLYSKALVQVVGVSMGSFLSPAVVFSRLLRREREKPS